MMIKGLRVGVKTPVPFVGRETVKPVALTKPFKLTTVRSVDPDPPCLTSMEV